MRKPPPRTPKGRKLTKDELDAWGAATAQDVKLPHARIEWEDAVERLPESSLPHLPFPIIEPPKKPRNFPEPTFIDRPTLRKLRNGIQEIEARLDLHGKTEQAAHRIIKQFLLQAVAQGRRAVLVITGKGRGGEGVLRRALPGWLATEALRPMIIAYGSASVAHGGEGAFYILLRRTSASGV